MSLAPGARLGQYTISGLIGEGGMGQVYRARDTRLDRDVAIKILPEAFAHDAERLARFQREARTLAALNHPHIAAIHGLEEIGGMSALVMEFVEGEDLSQRLSHGAMPVDEALPIAKQIAEALEAAHDHGIVHRDLKPANVKVRYDGTVKVLDFGLAKAIERQAGPGGPADLSQSPTITSPAMTRAGMLLGTAAYMAPEQARGRAVDRRADIWAFGCVLFEMLSGRRAFPGDDVTETLAAVVRGEPDWTQLPPGLSPTRLAFLKRTLQKDPTQRVGDIRDLRLALEGAFDIAVPPAAVPAVSRSRGTPLAWLSFAVAAIAAAVLTVPAVRHLREVPHQEASLHLAVPPPTNTQVGYLALSSDGKRLVAAFVVAARFALHVRDLDGSEWRLLPATEGGRSPFWSPDGRFIGFFADGALKVVPAAGGPARTLCTETGLGFGGTWNASGVVLFADDQMQLRRVDASGGSCATVAAADAADAQFRLPVFLPDGRHYFALRNPRNDPGARAVYLAALDEPSSRKVLPDPSGVAYAPPVTGQRGQILFLRDGTLMAQPFDEGALEAIGDPFQVAAQATPSFTQLQPMVSAAAGTLIYLAGVGRQSELTWVDRSGKALGTVGEAAEWQNVALSPDGNAVLTDRRTNGLLVAWLFDVARGSQSRFLPSGVTHSAMVWSHDSRQALFRMRSSTSAAGLYQKAGNGAGEPVLVSALPDGSFAPSAVSKDGRFLVYTLINSKTQADVWYTRWDVRHDFSTAVKFAGTDAIESQGAPSPDGKWMAYLSSETGVQEVYVRPFPDGAGIWKISVDAGREPLWSADGKQLYFVKLQAGNRQTLYSTAVSTDASGALRPGAPQRLFDFSSASIVPQGNVYSYRPHPDGQRFLINALPGNDEPTINVITNWPPANPADRQ